MTARVTKTRLSANQKELSFRVIPLDYCADLSHGPGMPVGIAPHDDGQVVRYTCTSCRRIWDCWWALDVYGPPFRDRYIVITEHRQTTQQGNIPYPVGPSHLLFHDA